MCMLKIITYISGYSDPFHFVQMFVMSNSLKAVILYHQNYCTFPSAGDILENLHLSCILNRDQQLCALNNWHEINSLKTFFHPGFPRQRHCTFTAARRRQTEIDNNESEHETDSSLSSCWVIALSLASSTWCLYVWFVSDALIGVTGWRELGVILVLGFWEIKSCHSSAIWCWYRKIVPAVQKDVSVEFEVSEHIYHREMPSGSWPPTNQHYKLDSLDLTLNTCFPEEDQDQRPHWHFKRLTPWLNQNKARFQQVTL